MTDTNNITPEKMVDHCIQNLNALSNQEQATLNDLAFMFNQIAEESEKLKHVSTKGITDLAKSAERFVKDKAITGDSLIKDRIEELKRFKPQKEKVELDLLDLAVKGSDGVEISREKALSFIQTNNYLIESLSRGIVEATAMGGVEHIDVMSVFSTAEMVKFLSGLNAHIADIAR
jgi:hypothetical protein